MNALSNSRRAASTLHRWERVLQRNRQALGGMNADIMTAKRVATINQQNTIYATNVTDYLQTSILFLCVAIVIMFGFGMGMSLLKGVMAHPVVLMQALLILLATVYIIVMLRTGHHQLEPLPDALPGARVPVVQFEDEVQTEECECPEAKVVVVDKVDKEPKDPCADDAVEADAAIEPVDTVIEAASDKVEEAAVTTNTTNANPRRCVNVDAARCNEAKNMLGGTTKRPTFTRFEGDSPSDVKPRGAIVPFDSLRLRRG